MGEAKGLYHLGEALHMAAGACAVHCAAGMVLGVAISDPLAWPATNRLARAGGHQHAGGVRAVAHTL